MKEVRSGYKKTKVGVIPIEWEVKKLGEIGDSKIGLTYSPQDVIDSKGLLVLRSSNIRNSSLVYEDNIFVSKEVKEELLTKENDILICARNGSKSLIGKNALITSKASNLTFGAFMTIYRSKYNKFLFHMFQTELYKKQIAINLGATINQITTKNLNDFIFPIPPIKEQEKIAEILSTWDLAIEKQEQLIEKKKEFKKGLMQRLLSGEVRFKKDNGENFPEWRKVNLGEYLIKHNEKSDFNKQYPVLTSSRRGIFLQSDYYARNDVASEDTTGYNVVPRGYFTYRHMSDDLVFKFNINDIVDKGIVSTLYPVFTVKNMDSYFLRTKLNEGDEFKRFALEQKQGGSRTYMYFSKLQSLKMNIPCLEEQEKISEVLKLADKEIELLEKELEALKLQKKGLMQRLLTGEVRVKV